MLTALIHNLIALSSAVLGALSAVLIGVSHRNLCALISFAAGALLATTFFHILPEASSILPPLPLLIAFLTGYGFFFLISRYIFHVCPACAASHFDEHTGSEFRSFAVLLAIALGIHNIMDGLALSAGHELTGQTDLSIFLTITIHKFPEGLALCALLLKSGYRKPKAFFVTLLFESITLLGWALGSFLLRGIEDSPWFYILMAHIGGGFIYLAFHAVLNESREHSSRFILFFFLLGIAIISLTCRPTV